MDFRVEKLDTNWVKRSITEAGCMDTLDQVTPARGPSLRASAQELGIPSTGHDV